MRSRPYPVVIRSAAMLHFVDSRRNFSLQIFQFRDQIAAVGLVPVVVHGFDEAVHHERHRPFVAVPSLLGSLVFLGILLVVHRHYVVEIESHELQLQLAVISRTVALLDAELASTRIFGSFSEIGGETGAESHHLRGVCPPTAKFKNFFVLLFAASAVRAHHHRSFFVFLVESVCGIDSNRIIPSGHRVFENQNFVERVSLFFFVERNQRHHDPFVFLAPVRLPSNLDTGFVVVDFFGSRLEPIVNRVAGDGVCLECPLALFC